MTHKKHCEYTCAETERAKSVNKGVGSIICESRRSKLKDQPLTPC